MSIERVEILVEEPSTRAALEALLPRAFAGPAFFFHEHRGKDDLLAKLPARLRGYALRARSEAWFRRHARVAVVVDRDEDDCRTVRARIDDVARGAGLSTRPGRGLGAPPILARIACEELEAWYFGDWHAVRAAYPRVPPHIHARAGYRDPDAIVGGTWEAFERVLQEAGYFKEGLRKVEAARAIGPHLRVRGSTSASFRALIDGVDRLLTA